MARAVSWVQGGKSKGSKKILPNRHLAPVGMMSSGKCERLRPEWRGPPGAPLWLGEQRRERQIVPRDGMNGLITQMLTGSREEAYVREVGLSVFFQCYCILSTQ